MSRTYRRKGDKPHNFSGWSEQFHNYAYDYVVVMEGERNGWRHFLHQYIPYEGEVLAKKKAWYHSDSFRGHSYRKSWRKASHQKLRMVYKTELEKFKKNPDYEIQEQPIECLSWYW